MVDLASRGPRPHEPHSSRSADRCQPERARPRQQYEAFLREGTAQIQASLARQLQQCYTVGSVVGRLLVQAFVMPPWRHPAATTASHISLGCPVQCRPVGLARKGSAGSPLSNGA